MEWMSEWSGENVEGRRWREVGEWSGWSGVGEWMEWMEWMGGGMEVEGEEDGVDEE